MNGSTYKSSDGLPSGVDASKDGRIALVNRWFTLTRQDMPSLSAHRGWPVHFDHCFQRILLDNAVGMKWRDAIAAPAYRNASETVLRRAITLGEACVAGECDLADLNRRSLEWRGKGAKRHASKAAAH